MANTRWSRREKTAKLKATLRAAGDVGGFSLKALDAPQVVDILSKRDRALLRVLGRPAITGGLPAAEP